MSSDRNIYSLPLTNGNQGVVQDVVIGARGEKAKEKYGNSSGTFSLELDRHIAVGIESQGGQDVCTVVDTRYPAIPLLVSAMDGAHFAGEFALPAALIGSRSAVQHAYDELPDSTDALDTIIPQMLETALRKADENVIDETKQRGACAGLLAALFRYPWPGNGEILLSAASTADPNTIVLSTDMPQVDRVHILKLIQPTDAFDQLLRRQRKLSDLMPPDEANYVRTIEEDRYNSRTMLAKALEWLITLGHPLNIQALTSYMGNSKSEPEVRTITYNISRELVAKGHYDIRLLFVSDLVGRKMEETVIADIYRKNKHSNFALVQALYDHASWLDIDDFSCVAVSIVPNLG